MRIPHPKKIGGNWAEKGGIFKSCPQFPKLQIQLLRGWGRSLKVTLQNVQHIVFAQVDGRPRVGSITRRPMSKDRNRHEQNRKPLLLHSYLSS
jgi:hypothetical protein